MVLVLETSLVDALNALRQGDGKNAAVRPPLPFQFVKAGLSRSHSPDRPSFDRAKLRPWTARSPGDRGVEIRRVDKKVAAELLLGLRIGSVNHLGLAILDTHRRPGRS